MGILTHLCLLGHKYIPKKHFKSRRFLYIIQIPADGLNVEIY